MSLLNYTVVNSPGSIQTVMDTIRTFAVSQGWATNEWRTDEIWNYTPTFGWISSAGNGDWLQLTSAGYGSQNLIAAIQHHFTAIQLNMRTQTAYSSASANKPVLQNSRCRVPTNYDWVHATNNGLYESQFGWQLKAGAMDKVWVFGNEKYILVVVSVDGIYYTHMHFGSMQLFDDGSQTQGEAFGCQILWHDPGGSNPFKTDWSYHTQTMTLRSAFTSGYLRHGDDGQVLVQYPFNVYFDSRELTGGSSVTSHSDYFRTAMYKGSHMIPSKYFQGNASYGYHNILQYNGFSGRRPMLKQIYAYQRQSDSVWCPLGTSWVYFLDNQGLAAGSTLTYGSKQFIVFPVYKYGDALAFAVRIA